MKSYKLLNVMFLFVVVLILSSCIYCIEPYGEITTETMRLDKFTKIDVAIPANIEIITGDSSKITITSYESYLSAITSTVRRGELHLKGDICHADNNDVNIIITLPELSGIGISGSANVFSETPIRTDDMELDISGSGEISLNVFANTIACNISGSGDININGTCQELAIDIAGSGRFKGLGLNSYKAEVDIAGSGNASIFALNKLEVNVAGSGEVNYSGEPELSVSIAGSGKINKIN